LEFRFYESLNYDDANFKYTRRNWVESQTVITMGYTCDLMIIGTGSLARAIVMDLSQLRSDALRVRILGRNSSALLELAAVANARAYAIKANLEFDASLIDWTSASNIEDTIGQFCPAVILHVASLQSPWEFSSGRSAWSVLIEQGGFGITTPLQAVLAIRVGQAIAKFSPNTFLVNACYPDAVNPIMRCLGLPIAVGIGNVSILAAVLGGARIKDGKKVEVIAHHSHIASLIRQSPTLPGPMVWIEGCPCELDLKAVGVLWAAKGARLNQITSSTAIGLLVALCSGKSVEAHAPGPNGLVGGYPIRCENRTISLRLPTCITPEEAVAFNQQAAANDGIFVRDSGEVSFSPVAMQALSAHTHGLPETYKVDQIHEVCQELSALKERLRSVVS
jgi:hypothetical protein